MGAGARRGARAGLPLVVCLLLSGCVSQGLAFRVDERLTITAPADRATVGLPLRVAWEVEDFDVTARGGTANGNAKDAGYFGVFVDRAPQPPGRTLEWTARKDRSCRPSDGCPDAEYLAARGIYSTTDTSIVFPQLPKPPSDAKGKERHTITIVLLDTSGRRIGESAFQIDVVLNRKDVQ